MKCQNDKDVFCGAAWRNSLYSLPDPKELMQRDFTYEERLIMITWIEYHYFHMITEEVFMSEITRLGYTIERVHTLVETK